MTAIGPSPADAEKRFRRAMAQFAAGVTVLTADDGAAAHGVTISSFTSVSLRPPLCLVCVNLDSAALPILRRAERFAVHVLSSEQEGVARVFAQAPPEERAALLRRAPGEPPRVEDALVRFDLKVWAEYDGGDHAIVLGKVVGVENAAESAEPARAPLTWWRSALGSLAPRVDKN